MITEKTAKALRILLDNPNGLCAREFGELMWNNSLAIKKVYNIGNGATSGVGLWLSAGSYLSKLREKNFLTRWSDGKFFITLKGKEELDKHEGTSSNRNKIKEEANK